MILGRESVFFVKYNDVFVPISCEVSNSMEESSEMLSTTTRDNSGWETSIPIMQNYTININAEVIFESDINTLSYFNLRKIKRDRTRIEWRRDTIDGAYRDSGFGYIESISDANEAEGYASFSLVIIGYGKPETSKLVDGDYVPLLSQEDNELLFNEDNNAIKTID